MRHSPGSFPKRVQPLGFHGLPTTVLELRDHLAHAASQRLELRRAAYPAGCDFDRGQASVIAVLSLARDDRRLRRRGKGPSVSYQLGPPYPLVERATELAAPLSS